MLNTTMNVIDGELFCTLEGRLDTLTAPEFDRVLEEAIVDVNRVTLDCGKLEYVSSAGLRTLLAAQQFLEENNRGNVKVLHVLPAVKEILDVTGFTDVLEVE